MSRTKGEEEMKSQRVCAMERKQEEAGTLGNRTIAEVRKQKPAKEQERGAQESKDRRALEAKRKDIF